EMRQLYLDALARSAEDAAIRAVVLTGTGKGFCTGADLSGAGAAAPADPGATRDAMRPSQRVIRALWELEKPIVAGVNGVAAGLGAGRRARGGGGQGGGAGRGERGAAGGPRLVRGEAPAGVRGRRGGGAAPPPPPPRPPPPGPGGGAPRAAAAGGRAGQPRHC